MVTTARALHVSTVPFSAGLLIYDATAGNNDNHLLLNTTFFFIRRLWLIHDQVRGETTVP